MGNGITRTGQVALENLEINTDQIDLNTDEIEQKLDTLIAEETDPTSSRTDTRIEIVEPNDIDGTNYVSGSEGNPKIIREAGDPPGFQSGEDIKETTFKYENSSYPNTPTEINEEVVTL